MREAALFALAQSISFDLEAIFFAAMLTAVCCFFAVEQSLAKSKQQSYELGDNPFSDAIYKKHLKLSPLNMTKTPCYL